MSDDEDYMSSTFMEKMNDVKPGVNSSRIAQRSLKIHANRLAAEERQQNEKPKNREQMEKNRREEGISKPIGSDSKGFKLLSLMGNICYCEYEFDKIFGTIRKRVPKISLLSYFSSSKNKPRPFSLFIVSPFFFPRDSCIRFSSL
uniref:Uncharacterized protein n=1 Tax=Meloidogyne incognita TaxID=6306 RepID=A0A914M1W1_MELIC